MVELPISVMKHLLDAPYVCSMQAYNYMQKLSMVEACFEL